MVTTTPFGELAALTASIAQPLRLPGQYADGETGLHQNWWRDYDPSLGRCLQADPIGLAGGANLYGYANANPVSYVDRDGRIAWFPIIAGATVGAGLDVAFQLYQNNGRLECVDWNEVALSAAIGALTPGIAKWAYLTRKIHEGVGGC